MYGGSGKPGRGGSGGGGRGGAGPVKRNNFQPSSLQRPSTAPTGGRLSTGGAGASNRNRNSTAASPAPPPAAAEESFSLVTGNPLKYAMIIRLTPDLVEEIKRVEAQGGAARIKFDANPTNPAGNVIDVGGKDFRFTWAKEMGHLLDIYEERQSGEDGNGLLVESGGAWRKVNVQRVLDESTKNHVKMMSEEAERKLKSRRAIVLDHGNPSMKNQMKALAAAEVNTWRTSYKQKKEPPSKKRKVETLAVGGPPKCANKSVLASVAPSKARQSASPLLSTPEQFGAPVSPYGTSSLSKGHTSIEDVTPTKVISKENARVSERETPSGTVTRAVQDKPGDRIKLEAKTADLQSLLISLLVEKPQGMNLKALEKAIGDAVPSSVKQIEPILKKIAVFQAPGRYILKPGMESEGFRKPTSESGSSPEDNHRQPSAFHNADQGPGLKPNSSLKPDINVVEELEQFNSRPVEEFSGLEKMDIQHQSPGLLGEKKVSENSEGPAGSSSVSGSDSDSESDSSDSGSDSGSPSRSKSRSPVGSGSGSSSDSETDASSNSKEGSDEDVDIMSDDDKEPKHKSQFSAPGLLTPVHNMVDEKHGGHVSDMAEIEKKFPADDVDVEIDIVSNSSPNNGEDNSAEEAKITSPHFHEHQESQFYTEKSHSERDNMTKDRFKNDQFDVPERMPKNKSKRGSDGNRLDDNPEHRKRLKAESLTRPQFPEGRNFLPSGSPYISPERPIEVPHKGANIDRTSRHVRDTTSYGLNKGDKLDDPVKSVSDSPLSGQRSTDLSTRVRAPAAIDGSDKYSEGSGGSFKHSERSLQTHDGFTTQKDKVNREAREEDAYTNERRPPPKNSRVGHPGDKHSDSHYRKHNELVGKFKEAGSVSNSQFKNSPKESNKFDTDKSPVINGRGSILRRELSDLELGELREPLHEEASGAKKQYERKNSIKQSENKSSSDYWNFDSVKGKPAGRASMESSKASPPHSTGISSNPEGLTKKRTPEPYVDDSTKTHQKLIQQTQQLLRAEHTEAGFQNNKVAELSGKGRHTEAGVSQAVGVEYGDAQRKLPVGAGQQHDTKRGAFPLSTKDDKRQKSNLLTNTCEKQKDMSLSEINEAVPKRRGSSSDDNSFSYSKYEKEAAELKGPIKDFLQYKEYVQEYREKYDSYCSLNTILESDRTEFQKLGKDLELAKERDKDRYNNILRQLMESYRQCGMRHKRLKKIFVVLHEELQNLKQMIKDYAASFTKG